MKKQLTADDKTILSLLDVSGSCIVDIFYNHLYDRAIAVHEKTSNGITECYRNAIASYVKERTTPRFYTVLLNSIHHYVRMSTIYNDISYTDCIFLYSSLFIPQMYANSLTNEQRINLLSMILGNVIQDFADEILQQHIAVIIDDHNDPINIEILQDSILKIMVNHRNNSYERFIKSQKEQTSVKKSNVSKKSLVQSKAINKLTDAYKKCVTDRVSLKKKNIVLQQRNKELTQQFNELKSLFLTQISAQKEQTKLIEQLKSQLELKLAQRDSNELKNFEEPNILTTTYPEDEEDDDQLFSVQYIES